MAMLKSMQFAVHSVRSAWKKSLQERFSFMHYGHVTEACTDHAHMETPKTSRNPFLHAHGHAMHTHTWKRAFKARFHVCVCVACPCA